MRFAFQSICFGKRLKKDAWPDFLKTLKACGYQGVEVFQHPDELPPFAELWALAKKEGITILGFSGGSLTRRTEYLRKDPVTFNKAGGEREPYLYVEHLDDTAGVLQAFDLKVTLALHYHHLGALTSVSAARKLLTDHPLLQWLPDTAHIYIGHQDQTKLLEILTDPELVKRTVAVHLKDWTPIYGRFSHRFARGFCLPGRGHVGLESLLQSKEFEKAGIDWVVVELDYSASNPVRDMREASDILRTWKCTVASPASGAMDFELAAGEQRETSSFPFSKLLELAAHAGKDFYTDLALLLMRGTQATEVIVCSIINHSRRATIRAQVGDPIDIGRDQAKALAIATLSADSGIVRESGLIAVPIQNPFNPNLIRQVVIYRFSGAISEDSARLACSGELVHAIGDAADMYLAERSSRTAAEAVLNVNRANTQRQILDKTADLLKHNLGCEGVSIFLLNPSTDRLEESGTTGIEWFNPTERYYLLGEGITGKVAADRSYRLFWSRSTNDASSTTAQGDVDRHEDAPRSAERIRSKDFDSCLSACFFDNEDKVSGVVRCRNPIREGRVVYFSEEDLSVVEAVMLSIEPLLATLLEDERRADAFVLLSHELSKPILPIRGALFDMKRELSAYKNRTGSDFFLDDYVDQAEVWVAAIVRALEEHDFSLQLTAAKLSLSRSPVLFFKDILDPAVAQMRWPLRKKGFSLARIEVGSEDTWKTLPRILVDRAALTAVALNLLDNAIKYAKRDPYQFRVRVWGERSGSSWLAIYFEDNGIGIERAYWNRIFERGWRVNRQRKGHGLGLWVVAHILQLHGGSISVVEPRAGGVTCFQILLPSTLIAPKPSNVIG